MIELTTKAENYAAEKTNEVMAKAIAQAYADGYRDGYKDREEEIPVDLRDNKTEYVDLGLPSGTLWAADYENDEDGYLYLSYEMASPMRLPTVEQWNELRDICRWEFLKVEESEALEVIKCIGPNGNQIQFHPIGKLTSVRKVWDNWVCFWTNSKDKRLGVRMWLYYGEQETMDKHGPSDKLPVRLVRTK